MPSRSKTNCTVVIPTRRLDLLTRTAVAEIHRFYDIIIVIVIDEWPNETIENVHFLHSQSRNLSEKRNQGVQSCQTEFVAFIDSDAYPASHWLEPAIALLKKDQQVGIVGGANQQYQKLQHSQEVQFLASRSFLLNSEPSTGLNSEARVHDFLSSSNMVFRRRDYLSSGGMNPKIFTGEDIELCFRFKRMGKINYFHPESVVHHKQRMLSGFIRQRFIWGRGVFTVLRYTGLFYIRSLIPLLFVLTLIGAGLLSINFLFLISSCYALFCLAESLRVSAFRRLFLRVFPFVLLSIPVLGFGTLYSLFAGDIDNEYRGYKNSD